MDNVLTVADVLEAAKAFFAELGMELEGETTVEDIHEMVVRLLAYGAELVGEVVQYEDTYRLAYIRGPEGIIVGLSEQLK
jgi:hypothetical protein